MPVFTEISQAPSTFADGIQVIEYPDIQADATDGVFSAVLAAYRHEGYEAGRTRAISDILAAIVPIAEEFLRRQPKASPELRKFVYSFSDSVETYLTRLSSGGSFVEGGLGI